MSLKRKMHQVALEGHKGEGDTSMLIWLSKQRCGYKDPPRAPEEASNTVINVHVKEVPK